jgi:sugar lactone lactonase YvrE
MKKLPGIFIILFVVILILANACEPPDNVSTGTLEPEVTSIPPPITSPPPSRTDWEKGSPPPEGIEGWEQPRLLTEDEKAEVIEIALNSPRASEWLQGRTDYRVGSVEWYAIIWNSDGEAGTMWSLEYDRVANEGVPDFVSPYAFWYPGVTIAVGEGIIYQMQIAVDMDAEKTAMVMGPYPSLSSPDRFKNVLPPTTGSWTTFTTDDGLASDIVTSVIQDNQGILWVAGEGLSRLDGTRWEIYPGFPSDSYIVCAARDTQGNLWFGTASDAAYEYNGERWQKITPVINDLRPNITVQDIFVDKQGYIWFAVTGNQGQRTAPMSHGVTRYDGANCTNFLARTHVTTIFQDSQENLWFGANSGVTRYDGSNWETFTTEDGLADNYVVAICQDNQGNMWFGTWADNVSRYDGKDWRTFTPEDGLMSDAIHCMLKDSEGNLWFGSYCIDGYYGISRFDGARWQHFDPWPDTNTYNVISIFEDNEGNIWFATSIGLVRYISD